MSKFFNKVKKLFVKQNIIEPCTVIFGGVLFGISMNLFFLPGKIILGGVTGITTVLNIMFGLPAGLMNIVINIPLLIVSLIVFGWRFITKACLGILTISLTTDFFAFLPVSSTDPLLCALLGGISMGAGCGFMFLYAYTTGGTDIVAWLLKLKFKNISTGKLIMAVDFFVIVGAAIAMKSKEGVFYSIIALFAYTVTIDYVMVGAERSKLAFVFSEKSGKMADVISVEVGRGVTLLYGKGWYTKNDREVIMCAIKKTEMHILSSVVEKTDPEALIIFADVSRIRGSGFSDGSG